MAAEPGIIASISELALWVTDLEAAVAFYTDRLGFRLIESLTDPGHHTFLASGDFVLGLFNRASPNTQLAAEYLARTGGPQGDVYHVAFRIDPAKLDSFAAELRSNGETLKGPVEFGTGRRSYFLEDRDQHYIELTDR